LRASGLESMPACSLNWNKDKSDVDIAHWDFAALPDAWLNVALAAYAAGQHAPLPLYPKASWAYACAYADEKKRDDAMKRALDEFGGNDHQRGDRDDADIALVTRDLAQPLDHAFQVWAERLLVPLVRVQVRA
jgi:exonuclease V gamma subunit